jgi:transposase
MPLAEQLASWWSNVQGVLFPKLAAELGPLSANSQRLVAVLDMIRIEEFVVRPKRWDVGRPPEERSMIARAFVAKAIYNLPTTRALIDRLQVDVQLRRICGWERAGSIPSESTFSRAFDEFTKKNLASRVHSALIADTQKERLVGHISRDGTEIEGREKPAKRAVPAAKEPPRKRGRPKKGEERPKVLSRIEAQREMSLSEMLEGLPKECNVGSKKNSKGFLETWIGYKLHVDVADGGIPVSLVLTSASVHDSQVAIPLATITSQRVTNLYDLMDAAYDSAAIREHSRSLGHVPIIDVNPRRDKDLAKELLAEQRRRSLLGFPLPEDIRYNERTTAERFNGRLKDEFGGRFVRVRGNAKVFTHLMFGILALTADQIMRLAT